MHLQFKWLAPTLYDGMSCMSSAHLLKLIAHQVYITQYTLLDVSIIHAAISPLLSSVVPTAVPGEQAGLVLRLEWHQHPAADWAGAEAYGLPAPSGCGDPVPGPCWT